MDNEASSFKKAERNLKDWGSLFHRDPLKWVAVNLVWLGPAIVLAIGHFWGIGAVKEELQETKRDRDAARTQLAPFLAVANQRFTDAPEDKRLNLLVEMVSDMTNVLHETEERTSDITKLPDGRVRYGDIVTGNATVVAEETETARNYFNKGDDTNALQHAKKAIDAHEASQGGTFVITRNSTDLSLMYLIGSASAADLNNRDLAEKWAIMAAKFDTGSENTPTLVQLLKFFQRTNEIQTLLTKLAVKGCLTNQMLLEMGKGFGITNGLAN